MNTTLVSMHFPLEGQERKGNTKEEQHTEDLHVNGWKESAILLLQSVWKSARSLELRWWKTWSKFYRRFRELEHFSLLIELLGRLPRKWYIQTNSFLLPGGNSAPHNISMNSYVLWLVIPNISHFSCFTLPGFFKLSQRGYEWNTCLGHI